MLTSVCQGITLSQYKALPCRERDTPYKAGTTTMTALNNKLAMENSW